MRKVNGWTARTLIAPNDGGITMYRDEQSNGSIEAKLRASNGAMFFSEIRMSDGYKLFIPQNNEALEMFTGSNLLCYLLGRSILRLHGLVVQPSTDSTQRFSGHDVLEVGKPKNQPGINYPDDYRTLNPINLRSWKTLEITHTIEITLATIQLITGGDHFNPPKDFTERLMSNNLMKGAKELLTAVKIGGKVGKAAEENDGDFECVSSDDFLRFRAVHNRMIKVWQNFDTISPTAFTVSRILSEDEHPHLRDRIDLTGVGLCKKFIPLREWFSEEVRAITPEMVFGLFPQAELNVWMLHLGRVATGRKGQRYSDGSAQKKQWRSLPVWIGADGGKGKSDTSTLLAQTLKSFGYNIGNVPGDITASFGWNSVAESDMTYVDDCSPDSVIKLLMLPQLKSLASGQTDFVGHDKGVKARVVSYPQVAIHVLTNTLNLHQLDDADGGVKSRLNPMRLINTNEVSAKQWVEKYDLPFDMIRAIGVLAERANTTEEVVMAWIMRLAVDKWESFESQSDMLEYLFAEQAKFRLDIKADHQQAMMNHYLMILRRAGVKAKGFEAGHFLRTLQFSLNHNFETSHNYPWFPTVPLCSTTPDQLNLILDGLMTGRQSVKLRFKEFMTNITSSSGFSYSPHINVWVELFNQCKTLADYSEEGDDVIANDPVTKAAQMSEELAKYEEMRNGKYAHLFKDVEPPVMSSEPVPVRDIRSPENLSVRIDTYVKAIG